MWIKTPASCEGGPDPLAQNFNSLWAHAAPYSSLFYMQVEILPPDNDFIDILMKP